MVSREVPLYHEIIFDESAMSILFSLCPEANDYLLEILRKKSPMTDYLKSQKDLSPFVFPTEETLGFGGVLQKNNAKSPEAGWTTWECLLPWNAEAKEMYDISGSISQIADCMQIFSYEKADKLRAEKRQFMMIDALVVKSSSYFSGGGFSFFYARPVLEFCARIWEERKLQDEIIGAMQKTWAHLAGKKKFESWERNSFYINECQGDPRLVSLACPGNCA